MSGEIPFPVALNPNQVPVNPEVNVPLLRGLLDDAAQQALRNINCCLIGTIVSFDSSKQTARIAVNFQKVLDKVPVGRPQIFNYPTLVDCPVFSLFGGQHYMTFPITAGDTCIILFNERPLTEISTFWVRTSTPTVASSVLMKVPRAPTTMLAISLYPILTLLLS